MAYSLEELKGLSDEELIRQHDAVARNTALGVNYFFDELQRRETARNNAVQEKANRTLVRLTWVIATFTVVIAILTLVLVLRDLENGFGPIM